MGTDIHMAVEVKKNGRWERRLPVGDERDPYLVEQAKKAQASRTDDWGKSYYPRRAQVTWFDHRNYDAFAILANVRNGHGFAGIPTGGGFVPISDPRGLPDDLSPEVRKLDYMSRPEDDDTHEDEHDVNLGDHSQSWLSLEELLAYDWNQTTTHYGCLPLATFVDRIEKNKTGFPDSYSGGISGPGIVLLSRADALTRLHGGGIAERKGEHVYVREEWTSTYAEAAGALYDRLVPNLKALAEREGVSPADVRIVFGFDS